MPSNKGLNTAKAGKKDEFFTQLTDIEKELKHYTAFFKGKTVLCNCDDPRVSNFFRYFALNFKRLGLKKLITTCYKNQNPDLFSDYTTDKAVSLVYDGSLDITTLESLESIPTVPLRGNGSYDSPECVELLEQADVVVTNPPFSLFGEYVSFLIKHNKKFLIIGNINSIATQSIFPLFADNKIWLGISIHSGDRVFNVPDYYPLKASGCGIDADGKKWIKVKGVRWFTNIDNQQRHEPFISYQSYKPELYPKLDNFDAIFVKNTVDIPSDYNDVMCVPITFLDKYNPDEFEIVAFNRDADGTLSVFPYGTGAIPTGTLLNPMLKERPYLKGKRLFSRLLIRRKQTN